MKHSLSLASLSVAALIALSACGSSSGEDMEGMEGMGDHSATAGATTGTAEATAGASDDAAAEHNDADVMFARMMVPHHEQAVDMSDTMLAKDGISPEITDLATRIRDAQAPEIAIMEGWLETWDEATDSGMEGHDMGGTGGSGSMEGMVSEDRMSELASAEGTEASRMFLESMVAHHEGAIGMARDEIDNGQHPEALELAQMIVSTQQDEIAEMQELLEGL